MPVKGPTPSTIAAVGGLGLVITATVTGVRLASSPGSRTESLGVLTLDDLHEGQVELAAGMVLTLVAAVLWGRLRRLPTRRHLLLFTALGVLALDNAVSALFTAGFDSLASSRFATWSTEGLGLLGVLALLLAAWLPDEILDEPGRSSRRAAAAACAAVVAILTSAWLFRGALPDAFLRAPSTPSDLDFLGGHSALFVSDLVGAAAFAGAAVMFARRGHGARSDALTGWLAAACSQLALSSLNYALVPTQFLELLYLGDYFFLAAVVVLLIGAVREIRAAEEAKVDAALHHERRRIARELHDGVTQELAYIAQQTRTLGGPTTDPGHSAQTVHRIEEAVERALDQSRGAITELSGPLDESLARAVGVAASVVGRRTGVQVDLVTDETLVVPAGVRGALVAITRVVVGNAVREYRADHVLVELWGDPAVHLAITWTSDPSATGHDASPISVMVREKAAGVDGHVIMESGELGRTRWEVQVP